MGRAVWAHVWCTTGPDTGTGREAARPAPATSTIVFSGSLGVQQTQGDRSQCGTSPVTGARGE